MPFTQQLLLNFSTFPLALIVMAFSVVVAIGTTFISSLVFPKHKLNNVGPNRTILFIAGSFLYILLLLMVLFNSWQDWKTTSSNVRKEANSLIELYRSTEAFMPDIKNEMQSLLTEYVNSVVHDEWKELATNQLSPHTTLIAKKMWSAYTNYSPKTETEQIFLTESIRKLIELRELRDVRRTDAEMGVTPVLWLVLIMGLIITVITITFYIEDFKTKLTVSVLFSLLVGSVFFTILLFDFPFTGDLDSVIVSPKPFLQAAVSW